MTAPAPRRSFGDGSWPIRRRLIVAFTVLGLVAASVVTVGAVFFVQLHNAVHRRGDLLQPAELRTSQLFTALVDQETGVRGYALGADPLLLQPYEQGRQTERVVVAQLQGLFADDPVLRHDLDGVEARANTWREVFADPVIAAVQARGLAASRAVGPLVGLPEFDAIRVAVQHLDADLRARIDPARRQVGVAFNVVLAVGIAAIVVLLTSVFAVYVATRRWVTDPLERLGFDARLVADGDLSHVVAAPYTTPDVRGLSHDLDAMRTRLVSQIEEATRATAEIAAREQELQEAAENLARSNRDLEQFAYVASHDLQEPLRKVASFCQLLERRYAGSLDERGEQYIAFAVDGAKRMQQLINDLLTFSRVGRTTETFTPVSLQAVLERTMIALAGALEDSGGRVEFAELPTVPGDLGLLSQLFQNLIGNALKFRGEQAPVVTVTAVERPDEVEIAVTDNGIGIDPAYAEKIFVIFQRLHARDSYSGTGIGLALCRRIVEFHGGSIWLDGDYTGPGTRFRFTLTTGQPAVVGQTGGSGEVEERPVVAGEV